MPSELPNNNDQLFGAMVASTKIRFASSTNWKSGTSPSANQGLTRWDVKLLEGMGLGSKCKSQSKGVFVAMKVLVYLLTVRAHHRATPGTEIACLAPAPAKLSLSAKFELCCTDIHFNAKAQLANPNFAAASVPVPLAYVRDCKLSEHQVSCFCSANEAVLPPPKSRERLRIGRAVVCPPPRNTTHLRERLSIGRTVGCPPPRDTTHLRCKGVDVPQVVEYVAVAQAVDQHYSRLGVMHQPPLSHLQVSLPCVRIWSPVQ